MNRTTTYLAALVGVICVYFLARLIFFPSPRLVRNDVVQSVLIGGGLAFVSAQIYPKIKATKVNGWITLCGLGEPGNGMLLRAAHAQLFPGPVNVAPEAMYWWTNTDGEGLAPNPDGSVDIFIAFHTITRGLGPTVSL